MPLWKQTVLRHSSGYGVKATNVCVNNRCFNDPRFPKLHVDGYENTEDHETTVGNGPESSYFLQAAEFRTYNSDTGPTAKYNIDGVGAFIRSMTSGSIPQAAIHALSGGAPGDKIFDLEPLYNDDRHIDYFVAPPDAQALNRNTAYAVIFSEGGSSTDFYKLYVTVKQNEDDNRHPNWPVGDTGVTKDTDASDPDWAAMRKDNDMSLVVVIPQIRVYAGVAP